MNDDEKVKAFSSPGFAFPDVVFEQVANGCYLVFDRAECKFQALNDPHVYFHNGLEYVPLPRLPWPTITLPKDYETETRLFNEIKAFFSEHLDVSNELVFDVYAAFVLASWRSEDFSVIPYQFFLGPLASGKTRALECFHRLCYRSIMASSMSAASLFRAVEAWHPTLLLDETEIYNRENMIEVLALLNSGYRKGQYAIRIEKAEQGCPTLGFFDTFGFKVLAGTEELAATLQSRCIITTMSKAVRHVNLFVNEEEAQKLRNQLIMYRFKNLGKGCEGFDVSKLNGYFNNARVIELFVSLLQVAPTEDIRTRLISCMKQITQSRLDEEQASIEARIFDAVLKCEKVVENGKFSTQAITEAFNQGLSEKEQGTSRFIGRKVTALGFEKCRLSGGPSGFFWDNKHVERLKARYYPTPSISTSLTSLTSQTSLMMEPSSKLDQGPSEVSEVILKESNTEISQKTMNSEVSEESEVSEGSLEAYVEKVLSLERLSGKPDFSDKCTLCGFKGSMDWQANFHDQTWGLLCGDCGFKLQKRLNNNE